MTRTTNARLAGSTFLFYIAPGITSMVMSGRTTSGAEGAAAKLASLAQHASLVGTLPLQLAGFLTGPLTPYIWLPALLFEVPLALWLLIKGIAAPARKTDPIAA